MRRNLYASWTTLLSIVYSKACISGPPLRHLVYRECVKKEPKLTRGTGSYAKTYGAALLTYARIEAEALMPKNA